MNYGGELLKKKKKQFSHSDGCEKVLHIYQILLGMDIILKILFA